MAEAVFGGSTPTITTAGSPTPAPVAKVARPLPVKYKPGDLISINGLNVPILDYNVLRTMFQDKDPEAPISQNILDNFVSDYAQPESDYSKNDKTKLAVNYTGFLGLENTLKNGYFGAETGRLRGKFINTPTLIYSDNSVATKQNLLSDERNRFAIQGEPLGGGWQDQIQIVYIRRGDLMLPIWAVQWREASTWVAFRDSALKPIAGVLLAAIPGVGQLVGQFILGPTLSASYPALASGLGAISVNTVMNGGDVVGAVKNYLSRYVGVQVGGAIDIPIASNVAANVTTAALRGGDLNSAAINGVISGSFEALQNTGGNMDYSAGYSDAAYGYDDYSAVDYVDPVDFADADAGYGDYWADNGLNEVFDASNYSDADVSYGDYWSSDETGVMPVDYADADAGYGDAWSTGTDFTAAVDYSDADYGYGESAYSSSSFSMPDLSSISLDSTLSTLSKLVQVGLQVNAAVKGQTNTTLRAGSLPAGTTVRPDGRLSTGQQPPPGTVFRTSTGAAVVNNGDGTFTVVGPDGRAVVKSYATGQAVGTLPTGAKNNTVLYAGLGIGAALLLKGFLK